MPQQVAQLLCAQVKVDGGGLQAGGPPLLPLGAGTARPAAGGFGGSSRGLDQPVHSLWQAGQCSRNQGVWVAGREGEDGERVDAPYKACTRCGCGQGRGPAAGSGTMADDCATSCCHSCHKMHPARHRRCIREAAQVKGLCPGQTSQHANGRVGRAAAASRRGRQDAPAPRPADDELTRLALAWTVPPRRR